MPKSQGRQSGLSNLISTIDTSFSSSRRRNSSPPGSVFSNQASVLHDDMIKRRRSGKAASVVEYSGRASSLSGEHRMNQRGRYLYGNGPQSGSKLTEASSLSGRRPSTTDTLSRHVHRPSRLNHSSTNDSDYHPPQPSGTSSSFNQPEGRADGGDSSGVSTVQSNVWDDMHEMKSHIHRIDQGRIFHHGSSNASNDRPRTATTTVTTVSSSPSIF